MSKGEDLASLRVADKLFNSALDSPRGIDFAADLPHLLEEIFTDLEARRLHGLKLAAFSAARQPLAASRRCTRARS
jgi:hypothetical protein